MGQPEHSGAYELDVYERWLLEMVVKLAYPVNLLGDPQLSLHLNRRGHDLPAHEIAARLHRLCCEGLIELRALEAVSSRVIVLPPEELLAEVSAGGPTELVAFDETSSEGLGRGTYFGLTASGGAAWEAVAKPDWSSYVDVEIRDQEIVLTASRRDVIERQLGVAASKFVGAWAPVMPWQVTYWKTLSDAIAYRSILAPDAELDLVEPRWFERVELPGHGHER